MFEVLKPAFQETIDVRDDLFQTVTVGASGLASNCVLEFLETFLSRPSVSPLKVIPQEVKPSLLRGIYHVGLFRVKCQSVLRRPLADRRLGL